MKKEITVLFWELTYADGVEKRDMFTSALI